MNDILPSLSIIIPTIGKPTLKRVISQVQLQLQDCDELIVASDGINTNVKALIKNLNDNRIKYIEYTDGPSGNLGHTVRNYVMPMAKGTHLHFLDDDDESLNNSLDTIRKGIIENPDKILIFKMKDDFGNVYWEREEVSFGNVSTQMIVVPNNKEYLGKWREGFGGDYYFLIDTIQKYPPNSIVWNNSIISIHGITTNKTCKICHFFQDIPGFFDFQDVYSLVVNACDNAHFVEVGSFLGKSISYLAIEVINSKKNIRIDCVDSFQLNNTLFDRHGIKVKIEDHKKDFTKNILPVLDRINVISEQSTEASKRYDNGSLDFVFIDADHKYESVLADIRAWLPKIKSGGYIGGHDYTDVFCGVIKAVNETFGNNVEILNSAWLVKR